MVPMWFVPVAIACGNAVVIKPSEKDPSAVNAVAALWEEAGLPDGVLNVVHGDKEAVDALLTHPKVKAVSFVGSTPIAQYVYETGTAHGKRVQALGGAKNHMLVLPGRRPRPGGRRRRQRRLRLGRRALHGDLRPARRRHHRRRPGREDPGPGRQAGHRRRHPRLRHGSAGHRAAPRQGRVLPRRRHRGGRHARHRRPRGRHRLRRRGLLPRADPVRQRHARHVDLHRTRSSARCSRCFGSRPTTRRSS